MRTGRVRVRERRREGERGERRETLTSSSEVQPRQRPAGHSCSSQHLSRGTHSQRGESGCGRKCMSMYKSMKVTKKLVQTF